MYKYIEVFEISNGNVSLRIDVSGKSEPQIAKICSGIEINLNQDKFSVIVNSSDIELILIK